MKEYYLFMLILVFFVCGCTGYTVNVKVSSPPSLEDISHFTVDFNANPKLAYLNYSDLSSGSNQYDFDKENNSITSIDLRLIDGMLEGDMFKISDWSGALSCSTYHYSNSLLKFNFDNGDIFCLKTTENNYVKFMVGKEEEKAILIYWIKQNKNRFPVDSISPRLKNYFKKNSYVFLVFSEPIIVSSLNVSYTKVLPNVLRIESGVDTILGEVRDLSQNLLTLDVSVN